MSVSTATILTTTALIYSSMQASPVVEKNANLNKELSNNNAKNMAELPKISNPEVPFIASIPATIGNNISTLDILQNKNFMIKKGQGIAPLEQNDSIKEKVESKAVSYNYTINENTTTQELEDIKKQAIENGIDFDYSARMRRGQIRNLKISMRSKDGNVFRKIHISSLIRKLEFSYDLAWSLDENGQLKACDDRAQSAFEIENPSDEELAEFDMEMARMDETQLQMEPKFAKMDSILAKLDLVLAKHDKIVTKYISTTDEYVRADEQLQKKRSSKRNVKNDSDIAELTRKIERLEKEMKVTEQEMNELEKEIDVYSREIEEISREIEAISGEINSIMESNDLAVENNELIIAKSNLDFQMESLKEKAQDNLITINKTITQNSTKADLDVIQSLAKKAGIDYTYTAKFRNNTIKSLNIIMHLGNGAGNEITTEHAVTLKKDEELILPIIWRLDGSGKAVDFGEPE
jgi:prefoldin subunit 5